VIAVQTVGQFPLQTDGVVLERIDSGAILVDTQSRRHQLNDTAVALWELCDGATSVDEMVDAIDVLFTAGTAHVKDDVKATLERLTEVGVVVWK
jgi:hypothetical protein